MFLAVFEMKTNFILISGEKLIAEQREKAESEQQRSSGLLSNGPSSLVPLSSGNAIPVVGSASIPPSLHEVTAHALRMADDAQRIADNLGAALAAVGAVEQPAREPAPPVPAPVIPEVSQPDVARLMDMGFPRERCIEALTANPNLDAATDYLLSNPAPPPRPAATPITAVQASSSTSTSGGTNAAANAGTSTVSRGTERDQDELIAIALSLGENITESSNESATVTALKSESVKSLAEMETEEEDLPQEEYEPLTTKVIDDFAANALTGCLSLLDSLPDTVYRYERSFHPNPRHLLTF